MRSQWYFPPTEGPLSVHAVLTRGQADTEERVVDAGDARMCGGTEKATIPGAEALQSALL